MSIARSLTSSIAARSLPASQRQDRGRSFLNVEEPGWQTLIDADAIDINSMSNCIVGQIAEHKYGITYDELLIRWDFDSETTMRHGFFSVNEQDTVELNELWGDEIRAYLD